MFMDTFLYVCVYKCRIRHANALAHRYETDADCAKGPHDKGCGGAPVTGNLTDILRMGHSALLSGWVCFPKSE